MPVVHLPLVHTVSLRGMTGTLLTLTARTADGPPAIVLDDGARGHDDRELRDRVRAALANSGQPDRHRRIELRLDPPDAPLPPAGAMAVAAIAAIANVQPQRLAPTAVLGDVGLDGSLRPTRGTLPAVQAARARGIRRIIVPAAALSEAALVDDIDVLGAHTLAEVADWLRGDDTALLRPAVPTVPATENLNPPTRMLSSEVLRAVEIAAAGGHHLLLDSIDGAGTLLAARWLHQLLPDLTPAQQLEVATIRSLTGPLGHGTLLTSTPPMATVHYSGSPASLIGGAAPGWLSQAHHGLLLARDLDEFSNVALEGLRFALLKRESLLVRGGYQLTYPARLQLVATSTLDPGRRRPRLPLALLDVLDIRLQISSRQATLSHDPDAEDRQQISQTLTQARMRVADARARASARWSAVGTEPGIATTNATVTEEMLRTRQLPAAVTFPIQCALKTGALSARGADIAARLAFSAADLDGADVPARYHVEEALRLRHVTTTLVPPAPIEQQER